MRTIYKYELPRQVESTVQLPQGAEVLSVQLQLYGQFFLWALVDDSAPPEPRTFRIIGTGQPVEDGLIHITTIQESFADKDQGIFVWHVFERPAS